MRNVLLDTGALVALIDRSEKNHNRCVEFLQAFRGQLLSTEPVLTEAVYLCGPSSKAQRICLEFFIDGGAMLVPQSTRSLQRAAALIAKYHDLPMDFADATLVALGEEAGTNEVFTLDLHGFQTYRLGGKSRFRIWPE